MLNILLKIYDLILPPPPLILVLRQETTESFKSLLSPISQSNITSLTRFQNPIIKASITTNKFHNYKKASILLASLFDAWFNSLSEKPTYLVAIPLGPQRESERGYNQVKRILSFSNSKNIQIIDLLIKKNDTRPQTSLSRQERLLNIKNAFTLNKIPPLEKNSRVIICDDVVTTGATLNEARATLAPHLPPDCELICLAFAH